MLGEIASKSMPLTYGAGILLAVQRLLRTVMDWQVHRQNMRERATVYESLIQHRLEQRLNDFKSALPADSEAGRSTHLEDQTIEAINYLPPLAEVEIVASDDPRVSG